MPLECLCGLVNADVETHIAAITTTAATIPSAENYSHIRSWRKNGIGGKGNRYDSDTHRDDGDGICSGRDGDRNGGNGNSNGGNNGRAARRKRRATAVAGLGLGTMMSGISGTRTTATTAATTMTARPSSLVVMAYVELLRTVVARLGSSSSKADDNVSCAASFVAPDCQEYGGSGMDSRRTGAGAWVAARSLDLESLFR